MGTLQSWDAWNLFWDSLLGTSMYLKLGYHISHSHPFPLYSFPVVLCEQNAFCSNKSELVSCHFFHICSPYLRSPKPHCLDLQFPHTSLQHLTDLSSVKSLSNLSSSVRCLPSLPNLIQRLLACDAENLCTSFILRSGVQSSKAEFELGFCHLVTEQSWQVSFSCQTRLVSKFDSKVPALQDCCEDQMRYYCQWVA